MGNRNKSISWHNPDYEKLKDNFNNELSVKKNKTEKMNFLKILNTCQ